MLGNDNCLLDDINYIHEDNNYIKCSTNIVKVRIDIILGSVVNKVMLDIYINSAMLCSDICCIQMISTEQCHDK